MPMIGENGLLPVLIINNLNHLIIKRHTTQVKEARKANPTVRKSKQKTKLSVDKNKQRQFRRKGKSAWCGCNEVSFSYWQESPLYDTRTIFR